ncbi:MAG: hypothetical protein WD045_03015 [Pirellulaceae bacterium]
MCGPANLVLIRGGHPSYHQDTWAAYYLYRELVWGPDDFENWVMQRDQVDRWDEDAGAAVVVDYDQRKLFWSAWSGTLDDFWIPRVAELHQRLVKAAWPGYDVRYVGCREQWQEMVELAGGKGNGIERFDPFAVRVESVREAAGQYDPDFADDDEDDGPPRRLLSGPDKALEDDDDDDDDYDSEDEPFEFMPEQARAWITLIDEEGSVRHRHLMQIPLDLLHAESHVIEHLKACPPAEVPPESVVKEGVWIDVPGRVIGLWGGKNLKGRMDTVREHWDDWRIEWAEEGYLRHCAACDTPGRPMAEIDALGSLLPRVLTIKRFDMNELADQIGSGVKGFAKKATGCLLMVICLPLLIFGAVSGQWQAVGITVLVTAVVVAVIFKVIEYRVRRWYRESIPTAEPEDDPAAGPLDERARRARLDRLLLVAGFPPLEEVEPRFVADV